jgi:type IX secretion system PorP/SprF family membrane protein
MFNGLVINPAYAGNDDKLTTNVIARKQWITIPGSPLTFIASGHAPVTKNGLSFGGIFTNDNAGFITQNGFTGIGSYRIKTSYSSSLSFGLQFGLTSSNIDFSRISVQEANDPEFAQTNYKGILPNFGTGVYFKNKRLNLGLSVPYLLNQMVNSMVQVQRRYYMLFGSYSFDLSPNVMLKPSFLLKVDPDVPIQLDLNTNITFYKVLTFGASYRSFSSINILGQYNVNEQLSIGYALDISTLGINNNNNANGYTSSNEIMVQYKFEPAQSYKSRSLHLKNKSTFKK